MTHELYISRDADLDVSDNDVFAVLNEVLPNRTWAQTGSGTGCGTIDLDIRLVDQMNQEQVIELQSRLRTAFSSEVIDVLYEEWPDAEAAAGDGPIIAYYGDSLAEAA